MTRGEATEIFGQEHREGLPELSAISTDVFGDQLYPTIEEKAAHLLYFVVKDYPFTDGNKRIVPSCSWTF